MSREGGMRARDQKTLSHLQDAPISTLLSLYCLAPLWPGRFARYFSE